MPNQIALRDPLTDEHPSAHEADWRQSVLAEILTPNMALDDLVADLDRNSIEYEVGEDMVWICHDRGGVGLENTVTMSSWAGYDLQEGQRVQTEGTLDPVS